MGRRGRPARRLLDLVWVWALLATGGLLATAL
jgi:hypothetical protein